MSASARTARGSLAERNLGSEDRVDSFGRVNEPIATRPYMPGYGTLPAGEGSGLLPWLWVEERLLRSHDFWLSTVTPDGAPHLMPVWAVWHEGRLWFSSSNGSRKARNLGSEPRCTLSTENPLEPVVVRGRAQRVTDRDALTAVLEAENEKYGTDYGMDMVDPVSNSVFAVLPEWVFALDPSDFTGSPTRFTFIPETG
jgi:nitroimidazol reductase NimA-like FMN-containing flavoprotein (pyridoxamine 5'-phosphate oxidase superfamily)